MPYRRGFRGFGQFIYPWGAPFLGGFLGSFLGQSIYPYNRYPYPPYPPYYYNYPQYPPYYGPY